MDGIWKRSGNMHHYFTMDGKCKGRIMHLDDGWCVSGPGDDGYFKLVAGNMKKSQAQAYLEAL